MTTDKLTAPALAQELDALVKQLEDHRAKKIPYWPGDIILTVLRAAAARLRSAEMRPDGWREFVEVIHKTIRNDEHGECWTIRKWLDAHGQFNGDLQGRERLIEVACAEILAHPPAAPALHGETPAEQPQEMGAENLLTEGCRPPTPTIQQQRPVAAAVPPAPAPLPSAR